jgi:alpha-tubulin suppressor-like RCC1 family protein
VALAAATSVVAVACGSGGHVEKAPRAEAPAATESAALTGSSCQASDVAAALTTDAAGDGNGTTFYAVDPSGNVLGWGFNGSFKAGTTYKGGNPLGFDNLEQAQPTPVKLGITKASRIAAHWQGACAITNGMTGGTVTCVGQALGKAPADPVATTPGGTGASIAVLESSTDYVNTHTLTGAVGITAGFEHACIWTAQGGVWCWGSDHYGQLGDGASAFGGMVGSAVAYAVPMLQTSGAPISDAQQVVAAGHTTCVLHKTGKIECVGANGAGELGLGGGPTNDTPKGLLTPINVPASTTFASLSGGNGTPSTGGTFCATTATPDGGTGTATLCWGNNANAQADMKDAQPVTAPLQVSTAVGSTWSPGPLDACEVTSAGALKCWGANGHGQLPGVAQQTLVYGEQPIGAVSNVLKIAVGYESMCALGTQALWCWGSNAYGELGQGNTANNNAVNETYVGAPKFVPPANGCGTVTDPCNVQHQLGTCAVFQTCTNNVCVDNPYECSAACNSSQYCYDHACVDYCGANGNPAYSYTGTGANNNPPLTSTPTATGVAVTMQGNELYYAIPSAVTSPSSYGSTGCDGFIVDVDNGANPPPFWRGGGERPQATINIAAALTATDCQNSRITVRVYDSDAQLVSTTGPIYGSWDIPPGGSGSCYWPVFVNDPFWTSGNPGFRKVRYVVLGEVGRSYKGTMVWYQEPVSFNEESTFSLGQ